MSSDELPFLPLPGDATTPRCWAGNSSVVLVSERGRTCSYSASSDDSPNPKLAIACANTGVAPADLALYYFEIHVRGLGRAFTDEGADQAGVVTVGFSTIEDAAAATPTYGYSSDSGEWWVTAATRPTGEGPSFAEGDVVGCGLLYVQHTRRCELFFTLNGHHLGSAFDDLDPTEVFHPVMSFNAAGASCSANFGSSPFCFDPLFLLDELSAQPEQLTTNDVLSLSAFHALKPSICTNDVDEYPSPRTSLPTPGSPSEAAEQGVELAVLSPPVAAPIRPRGEAQSLVLQEAALLTLTVLKFHGATPSSDLCTAPQRVHELRKLFNLASRVSRRLATTVCRLNSDPSVQKSLLFLNDALATLVLCVQAELSESVPTNPILKTLGDLVSPSSPGAGSPGGTRVRASSEAGHAVDAAVSQLLGASVLNVLVQLAVGDSITAQVVVGVLGCRVYGEWAGAERFHSLGVLHGLQPLVARALQGGAGLECAMALALCARQASDTKAFVKHGGLQVLLLLTHQKTAAMRKIGLSAINLLSEKVENKVLLVLGGALEPVLEACQDQDCVSQRLAILTLSNLAHIEENVSKINSCEAGLHTVAAIAKNLANPEIQGLGVRTLAALMAPPGVVEDPAMMELIYSGGVVEAFVAALKPTLAAETEYYAAQGLARLTAVDVLKTAIVAAGAVDYLLLLAYPPQNNNVSTPGSPPLKFPRRHRRTGSELGQQAMLEMSLESSFRDQAKRKSNLVLRRLAMLQSTHPAFMHAPGFKWVVSCFTETCSETQLNDALRLSRTIGLTFNLAGVIIEAKTLEGLSGLVVHSNPSTARMALELLVMLTSEAVDTSADTLEAARLAVLETAVLQRLKLTVKVEQLQLPTLQLVTNLLNTTAAVSRELRKDGALDIVLEVASTAEWEQSLEVDSFFARNGAASIQAHDVGRALIALASSDPEASVEAVHKDREALLQAALPWLLQALQHGGSELQGLAVRCMELSGFEDPHSTLALGDASAVFWFWEMLQELGTQQVPDTIVLRSRLYWSFSAATILPLLQKVPTIRKLQFVDATFSGGFVQKFREALQAMPQINTISFKWTKPAHTGREDDVLLAVADLQPQVREVSMEGLLSSEGLRKLCKLIGTKKYISKLSVVGTGLKNEFWDPLVSMLMMRPDLHALNLEFNKLGERALTAICEQLAKSELQVLVLTGCRLDRTALPQLSTLIQHSKSLRSLNLDNNNLGEYTSSKLSMLSPSMCRRYDHEGPLGELAQATYTSTSLCFLSLRHNGQLNEEHLDKIEQRCAENRSRMAEDIEISAAELGVATCGDWMKKGSSEDLSRLALSRDSSSLSSVRSADNTTIAEPSKPCKAQSDEAIVLLFAAPLAYSSSQRQRVGLEPLDYEGERQTVVGAIHDAGASIKFRFEFATTDTFRTVVTMGGCRVLHYSGHGSTKYIGMEDGRAGMHKVEVGMLQQLFAAGGSASGISLVFVSACRSQAAAEAFASIGVPHVVAVHSEARVNDMAVRSFTRAFYLALASKKTVKDAFEIGREAVLTCPQVIHSAEEAKKFVLLGASEDHSEVLFPEQCLVPGSVAPVLPLLARDPVPVMPEGFIGRSLGVYEAVCGALDRRPVSYTHLRAHETVLDLVCRLLLEKKKKKTKNECSMADRITEEKRKGSER
eukprot:TRINITY_DN19712_c0_g1_i1.p1 TRINITY_DN19712_c0_g1~~TRINITY_DN19712_c0_g1_i1.p1  ORF type:complete len:1658 (+),score=465.09 TRINITY_DN19712_c0_g1_i1:104-5077(+)